MNQYFKFKFDVCFTTVFFEWKQFTLIGPRCFQKKNVFSGVMAMLDELFPTNCPGIQRITWWIFSRSDSVGKPLGGFVRKLSIERIYLTHPEINNTISGSLRIFNMFLIFLEEILPRMTPQFSEWFPDLARNMKDMKANSFLKWKGLLWRNTLCGKGPLCHLHFLLVGQGYFFQHSKVVSTHLWNTPLNLYQQAIKGFLS